MNNSQLIKLVTIAIFAIVLSSCKDDPIELDTNILPEDEQFISAEDSLTVTCFTEKMDVISTFSRVYYRDEDNDDYETAYSSPSALPIGSVDDPDFGHSQVDVLWKCYPRNNDEDKILESYYYNYQAVLQLYTYQLYAFGDTNILDTNVLDFEVYEFTDDFPAYDEDSSNFIVESEMYEPTNLVKRVEYVFDDDDDPEYIYAINIYLSDEYISNVLKELDGDDNDTIEIDDILYKDFKLYIKPKIGDKSIEKTGRVMLYKTGETSSSTSTTAEDYDFYSSLRITYDYIDTTDDEIDTITERLIELAPFDQFYTVKHTYDGTINMENVLGKSTTDDLYIQTIAGTQLELSINGGDLSKVFSKYKDSDTLINRVELVMPVDSSSYYDDYGSGLKPPLKLGMKVYIYEKDVRGRDSLVHVQDEYTSYNSTYGTYTYSSLLEGTFDSDRNAYIINLTGQILNTYILESSEDDEQNGNYYKNRFVIFGTSSSTWSSKDRYRLGRLILNSPNNIDKPMYLRILYSVKPEL